MSNVFEEGKMPLSERNVISTKMGAMNYTLLKSVPQNVAYVNTLIKS